MPLPRLILPVLLLLTTGGCATMPSIPFSGLLEAENQLRCPAPEPRFTEPVPAPQFASDDDWVSWSDKLMGWGAEQAKRRAELAKWLNEKCRPPTQ